MTTGSAPVSVQRDAERRLRDAVIEVSAREGFADVTVERVLAAAKVSRATFYQYFSSVEDCFLSAYCAHARQFVERVARAPAGGQPELAVVEALLNLAVEQPHVALLLSREGLAAGPVALRERQALIAGLERIARAAPASRDAIDLPLTVLFGGVFRFLAAELADGPVRRALADEIREWASALTKRRPLRWAEYPLPSLSGHVDETRPPAISVTRSRPARERLLRATAAAIFARGYRQATVADIVATAGVSRRLFYDHFPSKREAFVACYEYAFEQTVMASVPAFFSSGCWSERVWDSARAFSGFFATEPALAHLGFVECFALGPGFLRRVLDTQLAFTIFLEEGYRQRAEAEALPRSLSTLTASLIFEAGFLACCGGASRYMRSVQPLVVYVALAPFVGPERATRFVARKLQDA